MDELKTALNLASNLQKANQDFQKANQDLQKANQDLQKQNNDLRDQNRDLNIEVERLRRLSSTSKKFIF